MPFKTILQGSNPLATDADQFRQALTGQADVGTISLCPAQSIPSAPTVSASSTAGNLSRNYWYKIVLLSGWKQTDGSFYVSGMAVGHTSVEVSPSSQQVNISGIQIGAAGTIGRAIYRSDIDLSDYKFVGIIWDNVTTSWTDNVPDSQAGQGAPSSTTTPAAYGEHIPLYFPAASAYNTTGTTLLNDGNSQSLASNGYKCFPGGLIIQWEITPELGTGGVPYYFNSPFPNNCFVAVAGAASVNEVAIVQGVFKDHVQIYLSTAANCYILAIGN